MNFTPDKERSREKIDGVIATIIAGSVALSDVGDETVQKGFMEI